MCEEIKNLKISKNHQTFHVWWSKCNTKTVTGLFAKLGIDCKGIHWVLCQFVELESVSNTSKKLLRKFGIIGIPERELYVFKRIEYTINTYLQTTIPITMIVRFIILLIPWVMSSRTRGW